jgi:hypothetical protein
MNARMRVLIFLSRQLIHPAFFKARGDLKLFDTNKRTFQTSFYTTVYEAPRFINEVQRLIHEALRFINGVQRLINEALRFINGVQKLINEALRFIKGVQRLIHEYLSKIHPVFSDFRVSPDKIS